MTTVIQTERDTQNRVLKLFQEQLGYAYLGNWEERVDNRNVEEELLRAFLKQRKVSEALIPKVLHELNKAAGNQSRSLYEVNKEVYGLLRYGVTVKKETGEKNVTVALIDWKHPHKNHFAVAEEVTISGQNTKRPDIVLYVNGIALGVLELKRATVTVSEGIRQNLDNQKSLFIERFFATMQFVMAGNDSEGLRYGTIATGEKYYLAWKEPSEIANPLDRGLMQICAKERFLELIHDFVAFDSGTKKLCRPNQYFGVKAAQERIRKHEGGIIWHTQGSGKSLTMVWLAKWIHDNVKNSRVLIITDRIELDQQIEQVFQGVNEDIHRTKNGADLVRKLNTTRPWLLCSLIHKFAGKEEGEVQDYLAELRRKLPSNFKAKGDVYVFVDECHRTQSGELHQAMKAILPNATFIGFTGTPLLKDDKQKSIEVFGGFIHTYKYDEAVRDGVVLDLRYEARDIDQYTVAQDKIDLWFELKTRGLTDLARAQLKQRWGTMRKLLSSQDRLQIIVSDIMMDFETRDRLSNGRGNALLVSASIYQACKLYEMFLARGFDKCAIVTSYKPSAQSIKGEETGEGYTEKLRQYEIYNRMLNGKDVEEFEKEVKNKFIKEPGQMKLLIVVDKLLTGFDAPPATYLFIDKQMRDHGLFQAICRVNRLDTEDKEYGYIIDYKDLFKSLERSLTDYTSEAFDKFDKEDVLGLLSNRVEKARERLEQAREAVKAQCEAVMPPQDGLAYQRYFCGNDAEDKEQLKANEGKRLHFYKLTAALLRAYANLANEMPEAGYSEEETAKIKQEVEHFESMRSQVRIASGDYVDMKVYEPSMRHLIDSYVRANESRKVTTLNDVPLLQLIIERGEEAVREMPESIRRDETAIIETIENNLRRVLKDEHALNPKFYEQMSALLDELIRERRKHALNYEKYLQKLIDFTKQLRNPRAYPAALDTLGKRALYDNLGQNEALAMALDQEILATRQDEWRGNLFKERAVRAAILKHVADETEAERIFALVQQQREY